MAIIPKGIMNPRNDWTSLTWHVCVCVCTCTYRSYNLKNIYLVLVESAYKGFYQKTSSSNYLELTTHISIETMSGHLTGAHLHVAGLNDNTDCINVSSRSQEWEPFRARQRVSSNPWHWLTETLTAFHSLLHSPFYVSTSPSHPGKWYCIRHHLRYIPSAPTSKDPKETSYRACPQN